MLVKAKDKNVIFMHTFRIPKSSILMDGVIPDYSDNDSGEFHYVSSERIANGDFCEKFSLKNANLLSDARKTNDFCPRAQLNKLLERCGKPELSRESVACEDGSVKVTPVDSNNTMDKVLGALESLIEQFIGGDLRL